MRRTASSLACLAWLLAGSASAAEGPRPRVVVVDAVGSRPLVRRLRAELEALQYETIVVPPTAGRRFPDGIREAVTGLRPAPVAVVALAPGDEVWILDGASGRAMVHETITGSPGIVVVRIVERLRTTQLEAAPPAVSASRPASLPAPAPRARASARRAGAPPSERRPRPPPTASSRRPDRLWLAVQAGPVWAPGGLSPGGQVGLGARWFPWRAVGFSLTLHGPFLPSRVSGDEGIATVHAFMVAAGIRYRFRAASAWIRPWLGLGVGVLVLDLQAEAAPPYAAQPAWLAVALPHLAGGLSVRLTRRLRLTLDLLLGIAAPRPAVAFLDRVAARWEAPTVGASLGLEAALR
jgi:hypothetical protein